MPPNFKKRGRTIKYKEQWIHPAIPHAYLVLEKATGKDGEQLAGGLVGT
jgi:hypothetical protein